MYCRESEGRRKKEDERSLRVLEKNNEEDEYIVSVCYFGITTDINMYSFKGIEECSKSVS